MGSMSRADELAADLESTYFAFADYLEGLSPDQWTLTAVNHPEISAGEDEQRPVGVVAHHVGDDIPMFAERAFILARGEAMEPLAAAELDAANARHAAVNPSPDQAATAELIRDNAARAAELIRGLSDEQLARPGQGALSGWTAEQLIRRVLIGHASWHEGSIRATLAD